MAFIAHLWHSLEAIAALIQYKGCQIGGCYRENLTDKKCLWSLERGVLERPSESEAACFGLGENDATKE